MNRRGDPLTPPTNRQFDCAPSQAAEASAIEVLERGHDIVISAVNGSPHYLWMVGYWLEFWRLLSLRSANPIVPFVLAVDVHPSALPSDTHAHVIRLDTNGARSSALVAQLVRIIWPGTLPELPGHIITSDIDMFPLSERPYAIARESAQYDDAFVVIRNVLETDRQFPICYNLASPKTWRSVFGNSGVLTDDLGGALSQVRAYEETHGGTGWFSDQQYLYKRVTDWEDAGGQVVRLSDSDIRHYRLDRTSTRLRTFFTGPLVGSGRWTDFHAYPPSRSSALVNRWLAYWLAKDNSSPHG